MKKDILKGNILKIIFEIKQADSSNCPSNISLDATFFELGLDSLNMVALIEALSNHFGKELNISLLFDSNSNTINKLANHLYQNITNLKPESDVAKIF
ncbi:MAG: acyl carrier protein [Gammaproteobacteria bacterium]|nr:acyl carrier protein [Gammaproteobacteria bacterium]